MISFTYIRLVLERRVVSAKQWSDILEQDVIPALREIDMNKDGEISVKELFALVKRVILTALA